MLFLVLLDMGVVQVCFPFIRPENDLGDLCSGESIMAWSR